MTDKAFIKKRGLSRSSDSFALENEIAKKFRLTTEKSSERGTLITGNKEEFRKLEPAGFRVKIFPDSNIIEIGSYRIDVEKEPPEVPVRITNSRKFKR